MAQEKIIIRGAREHNLKNINLELPRNKMIVFTGLSGSGKSSLAFDTIFAEGQRRYVESLSAYARQFLGQMQKPDVDEIEGLSPAISIDQKAHSANPRSTVATITEIYDYLRVLFARVGRPFCIHDNGPIQKMTTEEMTAEIERGLVQRGKVSLKPVPGVPVPAGVRILAPVVRGRKGEYYQLLYDLYNAGFMNVRVDGKMRSLKNRIILSRWKQHSIEVIVDQMTVAEKNESSAVDFSLIDHNRLAEAVETAVDYGDGVMIAQYPDQSEQTFSTKFTCPRDGFAFPEIEPRLFSFNSPYGYCQTCTGLGTESLFSDQPCPVCQGARLRPEALHVKINNKNIVEVTAMSISAAYKFFEAMRLSKTEEKIAEPVLREILSRLKFMLDVGLEYLSLNRTAGSLSGGEAQRIRLASQIGSRLVGALYVLDEPTIGLHQRDNARLVETLEKLRDIGNTIIVVEHDEDTILASDYLVDLGPGAGKLGGEVVVAGPTEKLLSTGGQGPNASPREPVPTGTERSLTLKYLRGDLKIPLPKKRRSGNFDVLKIRGASEHNLKNLDVDIPLRRFVCVTGVSGSGKSTLVNDVLYKSAAKRLYKTADVPGKHKALLGLEYIDKVIVIDQSAIGRTPRSNPATYTGAWTHIREMFALTPESRMKGYLPGRFSFNVPGGRCENCEGHGQIAVEMHFLPTVYVPCDVCKGARFDKETLNVHYKEKNIAEILKMTIREAEEFFKDVPAVNDRLKILNEVGLDYLELGQSATTLSGGEAQRVKLGNELAKRATGRTLYILDEPTTGLHFEDIRKLLDVLERLVNRGNTVIVIEHNLDVIKCADWIIDLGPEGGDKGGEVVALGTPEEVARKAGSYTGQYLKRTLKN
ncbi:MAG: UvrABC system protein A [Candidatus Magasanikbacteria bacterium]|nr:UvrABC system protein A [Candidatus Magasanikbacteria bacterium]